MKKRIAIPCPELTLPSAERRKRAKRMARITTGSNVFTKRMIRRLPSSGTPSSLRKEKWLLARYLRRQKLTLAEFVR